MFENQGKKLQLSNWDQKGKKNQLSNIGHAQMVKFLQAAGQFPEKNLEREHKKH